MKKRLSITLGILSLIILITGASVFYSRMKTTTLGDSNTQGTNTSTASSKDSTANQKQLAPEFSLKDLNGKVVTLSAYKGKIVILNFWATWCKYCKQEMPDLNKLNKTLEKDGKTVILEVDSGEGNKVVKDYLTANHIDMTVLLDSDSTITQEYGVTGFPTTFFINRDQSVYTYIPGLTDKETITKIINQMK
jgi:peroxiredoxin